MSNKTHQAIAEEAFHALEDESLYCKNYGHEKRAIDIILAAIEKGIVNAVETNSDFIKGVREAAAAQPQRIYWLTVAAGPEDEQPTAMDTASLKLRSSGDRAKEKEWTPELLVSWSIDTFAKICDAHNAALADAVKFYQDALERAAKAVHMGEALQARHICLDAMAKIQ